MIMSAIPPAGGPDIVARFGPYRNELHLQAVAIARRILRAMRASGSPVVPSADPAIGGAWAGIPDRLRAKGLRWTPQRRILVEVLAQTDGHVTGAELVERCRAVDAETIPSTVYRTLDVLEELGVIRHSHGVDGREEFHVLPQIEHGHLYCRRCGAQSELAADDPAVAAAVRAFDRRRGFEIDLSHLTLIGRCADCRAISDD
jgi:Fur family ferric uptake transcriptional regulator